MPDAELILSNQVVPSILSADFARLGSQVAEIMAAGARVIHVDVMDGHFVPPISFGAVAVSALADQVHGAGGVIDVHLMIERPEHHVPEFVKAGADSITVHYEATPHVHYALQAVKDGGCTAGLAICPATPAELVAEAVGDGVVDLVLCMSVNPGWGNQELIGHSFAKLQRLRDRLGPGIALEVDGGVNAATAPRCAQAGANLLVAGSAVFGSDDPASALREITDAAWSR